MKRKAYLYALAVPTVAEPDKENQLTLHQLKCWNRKNKNIEEQRRTSENETKTLLYTQIVSFPELSQ